MEIDAISSDKIDVVYLLGTGAESSDDWEMRMSLRSWRKHFRELGLIWIVGHRPGWLDLDHPQIRHVPATDPYRGNKDANLIQKMLRVSREPALSERFLFCSDDQGLLADSVFSDFRPYHCGPIREMKLDPPGEGHRRWQDRMMLLADYLEMHGKEAWHFDGHIPYPIEKSKVDLYLDTDYGSGGYPLMSLYYNMLGTRGVPISSDRIRAGLYSATEKPRIVDEKLGKNRFYSIGGGSPDCWYLVRRLEERFPKKAPWEIGEVRPRWESTLSQCDEERARLQRAVEDLALLDSARETCGSPRPNPTRTGGGGE